MFSKERIRQVWPDKDGLTYDGELLASRGPVNQLNVNIRSAPSSARKELKRISGIGITCDCLSQRVPAVAFFAYRSVFAGRHYAGVEAQIPTRSLGRWFLTVDCNT